MFVKFAKFANGAKLVIWFPLNDIFVRFLKFESGVRSVILFQSRKIHVTCFSLNTSIPT